VAGGGGGADATGGAVDRAARGAVRRALVRLPPLRNSAIPQFRNSNSKSNSNSNSNSPLQLPPPNFRPTLRPRHHPTVHSRRRPREDTHFVRGASRTALGHVGSKCFCDNRLERDEVSADRVGSRGSRRGTLPSPAGARGPDSTAAARPRQDPAPGH
jgi:hypothetical protein